MLVHAEWSSTAVTSTIHLIFRACLHPDHIIYPKDCDGCLRGKLHQTQGLMTITAQRCPWRMQVQEALRQKPAGSYHLEAIGCILANMNHSPPV